eukprot:6134969-Pyramimonas_sp.AAC.1
MKLCQFNVQSFRDADRKGAKGPLRRARLDMMRQQFHNDKMILIGIQEARNPQRMYVTGDEKYLVISSGHLEYNLGVELWASVAHPYAK